MEEGFVARQFEVSRNPQCLVPAVSKQTYDPFGLHSVLPAARAAYVTAYVTAYANTWPTESLRARQNEKRRPEDEFEALKMPSSSSEFNLLEPKSNRMPRNENERVRMTNDAFEFDSGMSELIFTPMDWIPARFFQFIGDEVSSNPIDWNLARCFPIYWSRNQFELLDIQSNGFKVFLSAPDRI